MSKIINHIVDGIKLVLAILISYIYKIFKKDKIYLIGERKDQCQDNGYHFFKYVREKHKEDKFYYCITRDSRQLNKIQYLGNIIYYKSFKHYLYYLLSDKLICAHVGSCTPDSAVVWKAEEKKLIDKNRVFIQHGIIKEFIPSLIKNNSNITTFICGAKPEYEFVKKEFGYIEYNVKYLGLCRFDNLHEFKVKKQILVMPTWRQWFGMDGNNEMTHEDFILSKYFNSYNELINSKEINSILEGQNMELIFYPHNEMQRYVNLFKSKYKRIKIAEKDNYDVQTLLKESKILITDYSSIAFDFAYMKKPIIYYQFDKEEYYLNHYQEGYFDYGRDGFGPIINTISELVVEIKDNISIKDEYKERINIFFELHDKNNCKRCYDEIIY